MRFMRNPIFTTAIVAQQLGGKPLFPVIPLPPSKLLRARDRSAPQYAALAVTSPGYLLVREASGPMWIATTVRGARDLLNTEIP